MRTTQDYRTTYGAALLTGMCALVALPLSAVGGVFNPDVYGTGATMADYLRQVPGGGQPGGPAYDFRMGQFEITNAQYAVFLNDAQLDGGATGRGSNMVFQDNGRVEMSDGGRSLFVGGPQITRSPIQYNAAAPLGQRFTLDAIEGLDRSNHPANYVSWFGAAKFANWLTIDQGFGAAERAYTEGPNQEDWRPVTISSNDWLTRDLNTGEREALVDNVKGFRLPMEDQSGSASAFNEFYKAAAWDVDDGVNRTYGYGRDTVDVQDSNVTGVNPNWPTIRDDPFEAGTLPETTPVGFYDGTLWQQSDWNWPDNNFATFQTRANENSYDIFDLSGNLMEWGQGQPDLVHDIYVLLGGSWIEASVASQTDFRNYTSPWLTSDLIGFRLVSVPEPGVGVMLVVLALIIPRRTH